MKLRDKLKELPPDRLAYVGSKSSFMFADTVEHIASRGPIMDELNKENLQQLISNASNRIRLYKPTTKSYDDAVRQFESATKALENYVPLLDRQVRDVYERTSEDALNILIEGDENGKIWSLIELESEYSWPYRRIRPSDMDTAGCETLANAIIAEGCKDLAGALKMKNEGQVAKCKRELSEGCRMFTSLDMDALIGMVEKDPDSVLYRTGVGNGRKGNTGC